METARLSKRVWTYIINLVLYLGLGFGSAVPFLTLLNVPVVAYVFIALGIGAVLSFLVDILIVFLSHGYTIGSALVGIKYVASDGKKLSTKQIVVRSSSESIIIFVFFDLIYFLMNRTERGVIDRLSDSFAIDTRI